MKRREFLRGSALAATGAVAMPAVARAQTSFSWKMTNAYGPGSPFYVEGPGSPTDFCKKVAAMSDGRLTIQHFAAGELIPALEGFDAVQGGVVEMNAANAYYWAGKIPAAQYFTTVPFGMDVAGTNAWMYNGGGIELWHEVYEPLGLVAFPMGNTGVQMTGWFRKEIKSVEDFNGLKMRIPGLAGKVYAKLGVNVQLLPGGEIFPALERGVIDAAEFVGPYQDRRLGLQKAAKYYYTTGWHEPNNVTELLINKAAWDGLPDDLKAIVKAAAMACNVESNAWCDATNAEAMKDLVDNFGVIAQPLPQDVVEKLREVTKQTLEELAAADPQTKKVHEAYMAFKAQYGAWAATSNEPLLPVLYKS
ncbi:TRAP transporter substrate-binding protein [Mangrovibrevibacter kandeliae]|uniref:TRAP transporter substrate-binding protein n=1 Tax=Mangrovibrevibacter kandeliae TaxID=2968473 RepID=UPI002118B158|nr:MULTISPECIES: TRAP transporter substrate-binding protein DctP [unclassified Aurantimonas]MCQ8781781.1 TRAP transporter substrate-binding protein DctP [Aurantimonas sp. CSK15Z-1]MCW4114858.1 TRAP transporter substrate-binding protein DctP [Aurantimonas sp. MSK8Z-1]